MKYNFLILILLFLAACNQPQKTVVNTKSPSKTKLIQYDAFETILDSANVDGAVLIFDPQKNEFFSNDFDWCKTGHLPASTFKITNSIIALETGVVENDSTLFPWDGQERRLSVWNQDLMFREAFHFSCVPCYQDVARRIGADRMNEYLTKFNYGNMQVDSSNIDRFWLEGKSTITQFQQIDFLQRFYNSELPISERTEQIMKRLMVLDKTERYTMSAKTGWSIRQGNNIGWFVGYVEKGEEIYFFATKIAPRENFNMDMFPKIRIEITQKALSIMGIISEFEIRVL